MRIHYNLYEDLGFFHKEGGVFKMIDKTITKSGSLLLKKWLLNPLTSISSIQERQGIIAFWEQHLHFSVEMNNGTIIMLQDFLKSEEYDLKPSAFNIYIKNWFQKLFQKASSNHIIFHHEYLYTVFVLLNDLNQIGEEFSNTSNTEWNEWSNKLSQLLSEDLVGRMIQSEGTVMIQKAQMLYEFRKFGRHLIEEAIRLLAIWDAWRALSKLKMEEQWVFPEIVDSVQPVLEVRSLVFPTIKKPVPIDFKLDKGKFFLLLTGANMSGKSTFLRAIGVLFILAQIGAPIPAESAQLTPMYGIYSNLSVADDVFKGESFFYAEVNSMKMMAEKVITSQPHLFLMDELFKGTNIEDAYQATDLIVKSLIRYPQHIYILSTHIYELAQQYLTHEAISTYYMETLIDRNVDYSFTYRLKEGVSNDKIGALMLQKEGIFDILNKKE